MRTFTPQFRRPLLELPEGCHRPAPAILLCCYKGNAEQAQTNTSLGAQTRGVAVSGNNNQANSGSQIVIGNTSDSRNLNFRPPNAMHGESKPVPTGPDAAAPAGEVTAIINNGLNSADVTTAISALANAFAPAAAPAAAPVAVAAEKAATETTTGGISLTTLQAVAAVSAIVGAGYLIFNRKKT